LKTHDQLLYHFTHAKQSESQLMQAAYAATVPQDVTWIEANKN